VLDWEAAPLINRVDPSDGRTVLDYVLDEQRRWAGTTREPRLKVYYDALRESGALHAHEVVAQGGSWRDPYDIEIVPLKSQWQAVCYASENRQAVKRDGRWGYLDENRRLIIEPRFQSAFSFSGGLAPVALEGKWGFIDPQGELIVPARFADVQAFSAREMRARVTVDGSTWTTIDERGTAVE